MSLPKISYLLLFSIFYTSFCFAKVSLPSIFSNHMVLQQKSKAALWGKAKSNATVIIIPSWDKKTYTLKTNDDGNWKVNIATPTAGGPFEISFDDGEKLKLNDILIGEVWVCSGQSNMEMPLRGNSSPILNASEIIMNADNSKLRLFRVGRATSAAPVADLKGNWMPSTSETAREYSALAFQYGQILQKKLNVPVGIILSTVGGTTVEAWMSNGSLKDFPEVKILSSLTEVKDQHKYATTLFNAMIAPLVGYGVKGFLWFQGESNRHNPERYELYFPAMVADWRKQWGLGELAFYYVQIAPYDGKDKTRSGPRLREAQLKDSKIIPNSGMISALDVGMDNDIHFMDKTTLAQRASYWALGQTYGIKGIAYKSPELSRMKIDSEKAVLTFDNAPYLTSYRKPLTLFEIAGEDKVFYPATATLKANQVTVQSDKVTKPVAVRYAYKEFVKAELYNNDGLPASSFRTDTWKLPHETHQNKLNR
ncbi:sialate O-acetylesterase [Pedobacter sp. Du54]|uniref:sialate O-acetylesterase n=1 Tax=Pedobacter anseongensis TaxID=3133439 RepID=UPI0030AD1923